MKKIIWIFLVCVGLIFIGTACPGKNPVDTESVQEKREPAAPTFQIEDVDGVPHIHNVSSVWKDAPSLSLEFVRRIGELNGDENHSFFKPSGIDFDFEGNLYVVDSGNVRIQKFSPDGEFLQSLGRKGQGPGEFQLMGGISLNERSEMHITDLNTSDIKVLSPSGEAIRKIHVEYISNQLERNGMTSGTSTGSIWLLMNKAGYLSPTEPRTGLKSMIVRETWSWLWTGHSIMIYRKR